LLNRFTRAEILLGKETMDRLENAKVAVFGVGGVGSYAAEALARSGVGSITVVDDDKVCLTNINRQLIATQKTVGKVKVEVMKERILEINPKAQVFAFQTFYGPETASQFDLGEYDYIVDAIDTVTSKLVLIENAKKAGTPIISCMGAGNKLDPTKFEVDDIYNTTVCPLAKVMRKELRARGIDSLKVVYSKEPALTPFEREETSCKHNCVCPPGTRRNCSVRRQIPGSVSFVPPVAGLIIAGEVIKDIGRTIRE
jgi:tRNA A37 threonylcarbamoyladenosine dehydratase